MSFLEMLSEATKMLKAGYLVTAIRKHQMDQAIIFCRTKLDCDNIENYLLTLGGGEYNMWCISQQQAREISYIIMLFDFLGSRAMVNEFSCACLHSDRSVGERRENLKKFKVFFSFA